ncbi:hypothetical protein ATCC90586_002464 [Pythium insidiosum]|nr:hypothetical protein ATCC90586_002464 [Pythium insidiosum]
MEVDRPPLSSAAMDPEAADAVTDAVALELAKLHDLEQQLSLMKVRCDTDAVSSSSAVSSASTLSLTSAASSPSNESQSSTSSTNSPPRTPVKRRSLPEPAVSRIVPPTAFSLLPPTPGSPASSTSSSSSVRRTSASAAERSRTPTLRRNHSTAELGRARTSSGYSSSAESVGKARKISSVETRRAYALSIKSRMSGNANVGGAPVTTALRKPLTHELEVEKQVLEDKLAAVEAKFEDEKSRREQFQVNVEQLTDVSDFIQSAMDGYNVCIFAYGQTGSGKTHTMQGSGKAQMRGIIPRSIQLIIQTCKELSTQGWEYSLEVTFFEIYNETLRDLLTVGGAGDDRKYNIRTDRRGKNYVEGLTTIPIDFAYAEEQVEDIVNLAACNRSVDKTDMNAHSSRSHSIFGLTIRGYNEAQQTEMEGSLSLVDLAGSERLSRSNATGERLKEAQAINKSLSALADVRSNATGERLKEAQAINKSLSALADVFQALAKKSQHVPYRNSKLTYVLQPALSGDGKTLMMVNLSPTMASLDESICSLRFAQNVSQCELGAPTRQLKQRSASVPSSSSSSALANVSLPQMPMGMSTPVSARSSPARFLTPTTGQRGGNGNSASATRSGAAATATPPIAKKLFM